jgi:hypothetical protein
VPPGVPGQGTRSEEPLAETVAALRHEVQGLRDAGRLRAVIEQAKGVLVERHGITLDEAFERLRDLSQRHNVRLVEVAATVVGVAVPDSDLVEDVVEAVLRDRLPTSPTPSEAWDSLRRQPEVRAGTVSALLDAVAGATDQGRDAAHLLLDLLRGNAVDALVIFRAAPDGSLRLQGHAGYPADAVSAWRSIPPATDVPYVRSLTTGESLFFPDLETRGKLFPAIAHLRSGFDASATIPVHDGGRVIGVVGLSWREPQAFDVEREERITRAVMRVTRLLLRHPLTGDPELDWTSGLLEVTLDPWVVLEGIPNADGQVREFVVEAVAEAVPSGRAWLGRRLLELWPSLADDGTPRRLAELVEAGGPWMATVTQDGDAPWTQAGTQVRAVRAGGRVVVMWRPPSG